MKSSKVQRIRIAPLLIVLMVLSTMFILRAQNGAYSDSLPILVNLSHMDFGDVFPGQEADKTFTVSYAGHGDGKYTITEKFKPKSGASVPSGYDGGISTYCQEHHDDLTRCYRNLCPYIDVTSRENEGDKMSGAWVSEKDLTDVWNVHLDTPAIIGKVRQGYDGALVSETGEYGCDLAFNVGTTSNPVCGNGKKEGTEECDDGNKIDNDGCSSTCRITTGSISGCKYNDENKNGRIDAGEEKLSGWEIQLVKCPYSPLGIGDVTYNEKGTIQSNPSSGTTGFCSVVATTRTGENGCYQFNNLDAGDYGVNEAGKSGWTQTLPQSGKYYYLNLTTGKDATGIHFLNHLDESIPNAVCGNGRTESGEDCDDGNRKDGDGCSSSCRSEKCSTRGSAGKTPDKVTLGCGKDATYETSRKDDGKCAYQDVKSTEYINMEWHFDLPASATVTEAKLKLKHAETGIDVYLEGWDGSKFVRISEVAPSTRNVESTYDVTGIVNQSGAKNIKLRLKLTNPTKCHECLDWAYLELNYNQSRNCDGKIAGCKYNDKNGNGKIDCGEEKMSGWEMQLVKCPYSLLGAGAVTFNDKDSLSHANGYLGACSIKAVTTTGSDGCYQFSNLEPGDYGVNEAGRGGWVQTLPRSSKYYYLNVGMDQTVSKIDFLNHKLELPVCGNGVVEKGEECDDGNYIEWDGCSNSCKVQRPVCGNGVKEPGEQCDDGNADNWDGCTNTCRIELPVSGNGVKERGEECDDGNNANGDGCNSHCDKEHIPVCVPTAVRNEKVFDVTHASAKFTWLTSSAADSRVVCGETSIISTKLKSKPDYGYDFSTSTYDLRPNVTSHNISVFELKPNTRYYCRLISSTYCGEVIGNEMSFKTLEKEVIPPPQVKPLYVYNLTSTLPCPVQVGLKWKTNTNATTCVVWSESSRALGAKPLWGYDNKNKACEDLSKVSTDHSLVLSLQHCKTYYFRLVAYDGTAEAVSEEQVVRTRCDDKSSYFPRNVVASTSTSQAPTPAVQPENGQVKSGATASTDAGTNAGTNAGTDAGTNVGTDSTKDCPTCDNKGAATTQIEKQRYMSREDWFILLLVLVILVLLINALVTRSRRKRQSDYMGGGLFGKNDEDEDVSDENKLD